MMHLSRLFPRLAHLTADYYSDQQLYYFFNNLVYLEQLDLRLGKHQHPPHDFLIVRRSRLLTDQFESEVFRTSRQERMLTLWIDNDPHVYDTSRVKEKRCLIS